jgi:hypothetical protein
VNSTLNVVEKHVWLSVERAERLGHLAQAHRIREAALQRIWDNEEDAVYDNWRELYDVPTQ